ncbi:MOP flippase family protein [Luteithermobacter gelatinilyticus]|uniref:MOP flippase family protein n=1 Tax=Luteithermobacter gelatinilyticus TaxID=2582913 RepID=UPI0011068F8E|nr:MOP flippase family protein [Luteithermobacter gelatinilyticus]
MSLKVQGLSALKWTSLASICNGGLQVAQLAILARLLSQNDFGLIAIITVILGFGTIFVEAGLNNAVIHRQNATKEELANVYTVNLILGLVVYVCVVVLAYPIASYYNDQRLVEYIHIMAFIFIILPWGMLYSAQFQRDLQFNFLAKIDILTVIVGAVFSILLAYNGFGVLALVYSQILMALLRTFILLYYGSKLFGFKIAFSWNRAKYFLKFGAFKIGENAVNYFNLQIDIMVIGKILGPESLGVYFMAKQLVLRPIQLINPVITKITLPLFAKVQCDHQRLKYGFLQTIHALSFIHCAIYFLMAGFAYEIVWIFLGRGWEEGVLLMMILSFYGIQRAINNPVGSLLMAKGKVDVSFYWNAILLVITVSVVLFFSGWGNQGVAWGLVGMMLMLQIPGWYFLVFKLCGAGFWEYFGKITELVLWALGCFGGLLLVEPLGVKIVIALLGGATYIYVNRQLWLGLMAKT